MIKFFNIRTGETREVDTEPMIAGFFNSTNLHDNAMRGQDFGWRLAPETVGRMNDIKENQAEMDRIAQQFNLPMGEVKDTDVLAWISLQDAKGKSREVQQGQADFEAEYQKQLRAIEKQRRGSESATTATSEPKSNVSDSQNQGGSAKLDASSNDNKEKKNG